jgi:hypothetical protein
MGPLSMDLRKRIVQAYENGEGSHARLAKGGSSAGVDRETMRLFERPNDPVSSTTGFVDLPRLNNFRGPRSVLLRVSERHANVSVPLEDAIAVDNVINWSNRFLAIRSFLLAIQSLSDRARSIAHSPSPFPNRNRGPLPFGRRCPRRMSCPAVSSPAFDGNMDHRKSTYRSSLRR